MCSSLDELYELFAHFVRADRVGRELDAICQLLLELAVPDSSDRSLRSFPDVFQFEVGDWDAEDESLTFPVDAGEYFEVDSC